MMFRSFWSSPSEASSSKLSLLPDMEVDRLDTSSILYANSLTSSIRDRSSQALPSRARDPTLILSLAQVAQAPTSISNDELLSLLLRRLESWVGEEGEGGYVLVVLATIGDEKRRAMPGLGWWAWNWRQILRKSVACPVYTDGAG